MYLFFWVQFRSFVFVHSKSPPQQTPLFFIVLFLQVPGGEAAARANALFLLGAATSDFELGPLAAAGDRGASSSTSAYSRSHSGRPQNQRRWNALKGLALVPLADGTLGRFSARRPPAQQKQQLSAGGGGGGGVFGKGAAAGVGEDDSGSEDEFNDVVDLDNLSDHDETDEELENDEEGGGGGGGGGGGSRSASWSSPAAEALRDDVNGATGQHLRFVTSDPFERKLLAALPSLLVDLGEQDDDGSGSGGDGGEGGGGVEQGGSAASSRDLYASGRVLETAQRVLRCAAASGRLNVLPLQSAHLAQLLTQVGHENKLCI